MVLVPILSLKCYPCKNGCVVNNPKNCHPIIMATFGECNMTLHCFQQQLSLLLCKLEGEQKCQQMALVGAGVNRVLMLVRLEFNS